MPQSFHRTFFLDGPAGRLEAMLWTTEQRRPACVALVCHPHPLFGGTMHNKVVFQTAKTLHDLGMPVLRFNFRGAGLSEGWHDNGHGEIGDVETALNYLQSSFAGIPILLAGFSFGAFVGLRVGCADTRVRILVGAGVPVDSSDLSYLAACEKPKLILQSSQDQYGARTGVEKLFATLAEPKDLIFIEAPDHFFTGKLDEMGRALGHWAEAQLQNIRAAEQ